MTEHHLSVQRTARYFTLGNLTDQTRNVWFCLHGFGQLAQYFANKFTDLDDGQTLIVVPEGLSRLYLNGDYKRVGASWLTREDKPHEIRDFIAYLNDLYDRVLTNRDQSTGPSSPLHLTLLGFSQGAATACRWLNAGHVRADRLILWAGFFPNGLGDVIDTNKLTSVETHYVYGRQDEYMAQMADTNSYLRRMQTEVPGLTMTAYDGGHRVEPAVLQRLLRST